MAAEPKDLSTVLDLLGSTEKAPTAEHVWAQESIVFPAHWKRQWPDFLPLAPVLDRPEARLKVSRSRLFELGQSIEPEADAVNFYGAVCAWGADGDAQQVHRSIRPLLEPGAPERLLEGLRVAAASSADVGYAVFNHSGRAKIKGLGPAYFTKLLYFAAGRPTSSDTRHPLILDRRVALALGWKKPDSWGNTEYSRYLDLVEQLHERWRPDLPTDVIEYVLFLAERNLDVPSL